MTTSGTDTLTVEEARRLVAPLYDGLNRPAEKDTHALLAQAAADDYRSYFTNETWVGREELADIMTSMGATIPNLSWSIEDIFVHGDRIVVRGRTQGTPVATFNGVEPTGKSFDSMAIDIFTVRDGKLANCYHIENWAAAVQQLQGES